MAKMFSHLPDEREAIDEPGTGLRFTDVLFGFVFKELFTRLTNWATIDNITRSHLVLGSVLVLGSYVGFRNSLKRGEFPLRFINLPFLKFSLDQMMVILYFLVATATPPYDAARGFVASTPDLARNDALLLLFIACLYLIWDLLSAAMCRRGYAIKFDWLGVWITAAFLAAIALAACAIGALDDELTEARAILVEDVMIAVLVLYRFLKDHRNRDSVTDCRTAPGGAA